MSFIHRAASHFVSTDSRCNDHSHVLHFAVQFFRPTLPTPKRAELFISIINSAKELTTLHVKVEQGGKQCLAGHLTYAVLLYLIHVLGTRADQTRMADLTIQKEFSIATGWQLLPTPLEASMDSFESNSSQDWVGYSTPFSSTSYRRAHSYTQFWVPIKNQAPERLDQWKTRAWKDKEASAGAVWTDETIHFAIDNTFSLLNDMIDTSQDYTLHEAIVEAGLAQRQARLEEIDDRIVGEGLTAEASPFHYTVATITITTEIKRLLPPGGTKWLFMRITTRSILNDRLDYGIVILDSSKQLIAVSNHVLQIIHVDRKRARRPAL